MNNQNKSIFIYSFYRFINIKNIKSIKKQLDVFFLKKNIYGTILISNEGINGSISGQKEELEENIKFIKKKLNIRKLDIKINENKFVPFKKLKIKLKNEIVSFAQEKVDVNKYRGKKASPAEWNKIIQNKETKVIDVRNNYEINIGKFEYSKSPNTNNFREFPKFIERLNISKNTKIAMYCTGGIRCEKASAYLKINGFKDVVQLDGGILKYLEYIKNNNKKSLWKGECFVFDERVAINKKLIKGRYLQCYGCRMPITKDDTNSKYYEKGVSCHYCFHQRTEKQKQRSLTRQKQIDNLKKRNTEHSLKKSSLN